MKDIEFDVNGKKKREIGGINYEPVEMGLMGNRRRQRNQFNSYLRRTLARKSSPTLLPNGRYAMEPGYQELKREIKLISYNRVLQIQRDLGDNRFEAERLMNNPAQHPRVPDTHNGMVPNGWKTVYYSSSQRRR